MVVAEIALMTEIDAKSKVKRLSNVVKVLIYNTYLFCSSRQTRFLKECVRIRF